MRINVSKLLLDKDLGSTTFVRKRPTTSVAHEGEKATTYATATLSGIVQPAATADLQLLPEGTRLSEVKAFFTAGDVSAGAKASLSDLLVHGGQTYRVLHLQDFGAHGMRKALAQLVATGTPAGGA